MLRRNTRQQRKPCCVVRLEKAVTTLGKIQKVYLAPSLKNKNIKPLGKGQQTVLPGQLGQGERKIKPPFKAGGGVGNSDPIKGILPLGEGQDHLER